MLRPHSDDAEELEAETVAEEASVWLQETAKKAVSYARSSPLFLHAHWTLTASTSIRHSEATQLWCRWQETLLAAARLLRPVCRNLDSERHAVRQEIARLTSQLRSDSHSGSNDSSPRGNLPPTDEMQSTLHEAIEIASRWLRLSGAKASSISTPMSQDALDLRDEVLERTAGVLSELNAQWHMNASPMVRTAIVCCRRSIERIHSLFEGSRELDLQEPELRQVLNAELLKIPGLELNEQWLPEIDAEDVERALIEHIEQGDVTWRQAFEAHSMHGDHVATDRLLKLNVWSDADELNDLRLRRESQIAEERQVLTRELNDLSIDLETITACGLLDSEDGDIFMRRLERMQRDLTRSSNIGSCRWELDQIRGALQRLRTQPLAAMALASTDRLSATPLHPRSRGDSATMTDQTAMPLSFETAALVTDIFSEE